MMPVSLTLEQALNKLVQLEAEGKFQEGEQLAKNIITANPFHAHAHHMMGIYAHRLGRMNDAIKHMEFSEHLNPIADLYPRNMCEIYRAAGELDKAYNSALRAITLNPSDKSSLFNMSLIEYERQNIDSSIEYSNKAIKLDPNFAEAYFERAETLLLAGRLKEGWEDYEWRFKIKQAENMIPPLGIPQWDGSPLGPGELVIITDQGFGDCIQFSRFIPWAATLCPSPVLASSPELEKLFKNNKHIGKIVITWQEAQKCKAYIPMTGLARLYGATLDNLPPSGYIKPSLEKLQKWEEEINRIAPRHGLKRVAIVWAGRPTHKNDKKRTLKLSQFKPLLDAKHIQLFSVQKGPQVAEVADVYGKIPIINLSPGISDFQDTLAILKNMDHLVSIDTSVVHLAGAANIPTSLILPYTPDWRWLLNRDDSPWYSTIKLYRQTIPYSWENVLERVATDL